VTAHVSQPRGDSTPAWWIRDSGVLAVGLTVFFFHQLGVHYVDAFYANNPPHYDSVGSYTMMFEIITQCRQGAWAAATTHALGSFLSWLQSFFALLASRLLDTRPAGVQALNSLAMGALVASIYACARAAGAGRLRAYLLSLIAFTPDVFYDWWGGALDMRRDFAFVALLTGSAFALLALHWRPSRGASIWFGLCTALTVASRDNAFVFVVVMIAAPAAVLALHAWLTGARDVVRRYVFAAWTALPIVLPWGIAVLPLALQRRLDPFAMYGTGGDPWTALRLYWHYPFALMGGRPGEFPLIRPTDWTSLGTPTPFIGEVVTRLGAMGGGTHGTLPLTMVLWSIAVMALLAALMLGVCRARGSVRAAQCALLGLWSYGATLFIICVLAGLRPMAFTTAQIPFFPALLAFMAAAFAVGLSITAGQRHLRYRTKACIAVLACAAVFARSVIAIEAKAPQPTPHFVALGQQLTDLLLAVPGQVTVAFLWHEGISFDTSTYYAAQRGDPGRLLQLRYAHAGRLFDLQVGVPEGADPDAMLDALAAALPTAQFVVVSTRPERYAGTDSPFLIFRHGQALVDSLLSSPAYRISMRFTVWNDEVVVLSRQRP